MNGFSEFNGLTASLIMLIMLISILFFKRKRVLFPSIVFVLSVILFIFSFILGEWEGMGLGAFSVSLLIASFISLALLIIYQAFKTSKK